MNIYLSYKQSGIDPELLVKELSFLKRKIEETWNKLYVFYFEENSEQAANILNKKFLDKIKESDLVLAYINYPEKSEWQLLELWMSYALWKKIIILVNEKVKKNYYLVYWLGKSIEFSNLNDLNFKEILDGFN